MYIKLKTVKISIHIHEMAKQNSKFHTLIYNNIKGKLFVEMGKSQHLCSEKSRNSVNKF